MESDKPTTPPVHLIHKCIMCLMEMHEECITGSKDPQLPKGVKIVCQCAEEGHPMVVPAVTKSLDEIKKEMEKKESEICSHSDFPHKCSHSDFPHKHTKLP